MTMLRELYHSDEHTATLEDLRERTADELDLDAPTDDDVRGYIAAHGWEPVTTCGLCDRKLPEDNTLGICDGCAGTCQAHARHEQARTEWERDGRPD